MEKFVHRANDATIDARRNLDDLTHYVSQDSCRFHKSRILAFRVHCDGWICSIIESVALDPNNRKRGFRYVVFDVFGDCVSRVSLEECAANKNEAWKQLYQFLNSFDHLNYYANQITRKRKRAMDEFDRLEDDIRPKLKSGYAFVGSSNTKPVQIESMVTESDCETSSFVGTVERYNVFRLKGKRRFAFQLA